MAEPRLRFEDMDDQVSIWKRIKTTIANTYSLGVIAFGGPTVHVALFHNHFVENLKWISAETFVELFAIAQSLPGPASTQLLFSIVLITQGWIPAIICFILWSLPGLIMMIGLAIGVSSLRQIPEWLYTIENGLTSAAVGLIALAALNLSKKVNDGNLDNSLSLLAIIVALNFSREPWLLPAIMAFGAVFRLMHGWFYKKEEITLPGSFGSENEPLLAIHLTDDVRPDISTRNGLAIIIVWFTILLSFLLLNTPIKLLQVIKVFFIVGSVIFGGGPVVIPLLQSFVVTDQGWCTDAEFLIGLAIIQAMPGPMFNIAAFCGTLACRDRGIGGAIAGGIFGYLGIFVPGLLIKSGVLPCNLIIKAE